MKNKLPKVHPLRLTREVYKRIGSNNIQLTTNDYYDMLELLEEELILEWAKDIVKKRESGNDL